MLLGDCVRYARTRKGLSARAVSREAELSPSYVQKLEAGDIDPTLKSFAKIAQVLGLNSEEILFCVREEIRK